MIDRLPSQPILGLGASMAMGDAKSTEANAPGDDFASMLAGFAKQSIQTMRDAEQTAVAGLKGQAPIQEVVDKVMAADQALQSALAVREKVVSAWLEISRITI